MPKTVLIVGNSDGIGAAVTEALVARGDRVIGISRSRSPLGATGPRHEIHDVTALDFPAVVRRLAQEEGGFDACIYCAGTGSLLRLPDLSREADVFEINLVGMVKTMEALVPTWIEQKRGHFIGLSSLADDFYNPEAPSYSASKAGFSNYLLSMGLTLRPYGITVTNVRFGFVDTKMAKATNKPLMMSRQTAANHILRCLETKPRQLSIPKIAGAVVHVIHWMQSVRIWLS